MTADTGGAAAGRPTRVLWLIKGLGLGGAERLLVDMAANRDRRSFHYEAAYVLDAQDALAADLAATGVPVHPLGAGHSADLRWVRALRRLLADNRYDIVHAHLPYTAAFGRLAVMSMPPEDRPLLVYTEHSLWNKAAVVTRALNRATVGMDRAIFTVSEASLAALPNRLRRRATVVVHGVDRRRAQAALERHGEMRARLRSLVGGVDDDDLVAITVANLRSEKGYDVLLDAAARCQAEGAAVRFASVGSGPLLADLVDECRRRGLDDRVTFLGQRTDTLELMAGADLFVLPSHQEGLPVALMEAMSVGLPVVATAVGGVPGALADGAAGLVVPPGDGAQLGGAVLRMAADPELRARLGASALAASARFDIAAAVAQIEAVYRQLLAGRPAAPVALPARSAEPLVLHVIPTAVARGAQREARALADHLDRPGTRRHELMSLFAGPTDVAVDHALEHPGGRGPTAAGFDPRLVVRLRRTLRRLRPVVVVAHGGDALKYVASATLGWRLPIAYYATGTFSAADNPWQLRLWRALIRRADAVAAEGDEVLAECQGLLQVEPARLSLAPNGRDPEQFHPRSTGNGDVDGDPVLVFVGALNPGKGPDRFVDAVVALRRQGMSFRAVVCGDGPMRNELQHQAEEVQVELLGVVDDVASVLRGADVMLFPSRPTGEGMPGVLIEAGLSALPVVACQVPGTRAIIEDGVTGFLVPVDDLDAMVEKTGRLLADPAQRRLMGAAARQRCVERFTIDTVTTAWIALLEPLMVRRR